MEVNWIVKASRCLWALSPIFKAATTLVLWLSKADDLLYGGYQDDSLETLSTEHLYLVFSWV